MRKNLHCYNKVTEIIWTQSVIFKFNLQIKKFDCKE
jgi:hypothetical protein